MKKLIPLLLITVLVHQSYSFTWEWESFGSPEIKANKVCFFNTGPVFSVICVDTGMYISGITISFEFYSYTSMAVVEAVSPGFNEDSLILVMSNGSWSDGIYSFNYETKEFVPLHFCYNPNFIVYSYENSWFYVGYEYGLYYSEDAINWTGVTFFDNKTCLDMEISGDYLIVATTEEYNNTFLSDDNGATWTELEGENITELANDILGISTIYGISEGESYNCGFYQLDFSNQEWDNIFYSYRLNAVGMNNVGALYVGWYSGIPPNEGIAACSPELTFLNDGLPNLNINAITAPMIFGVTVIYCCTDSGVFTRILSVGVPENPIIDYINIYPNPVSNQATININLSELANEEISISILNNQGQKVDEIKMEGNNSNEIIINWNKGNLPAGVYYLLIETEKEQLSKKFIIL